MPLLYGTGDDNAEVIKPEFGHLVFPVHKVLAQVDTPFQSLLFFENSAMGRCLGADGVVQISERDDPYYHEMLVHMPLLAHGQVKRALIIGGGDGGALRHMLMHHGVAQVVMVEIDQVVVELSAQHLSSICGTAFTDPRAEILFQDGADFVRNSNDLFDLIIIDSTDPFGPGEVLFKEEFYQACKQRLASGGMMVGQIDTPYVLPEILQSTSVALKNHFNDVWYYRCAVPCYGYGDTYFYWATDNAELRQVTKAELTNRYTAASLDTFYYNSDMHLAALALPNFVQKLIG